MYLHIPIPYIHRQLIPRPPVAGVRPVREVAEEAAPRPVDLAEGGEVAVDGVGEAHGAVPVRDDDGPVEGARDVQADVAVDGGGVQDECTAGFGTVLIFSFFIGTSADLWCSRGWGCVRFLR